MADFTKIEDKLMKKSEFIVMLINGLTESLVRNELDIDVLQSQMFSAHKEKQTEIPKYLQAQNALKEQNALTEVRLRIAHQLLSDYQKKEQKNNN